MKKICMLFFITILSAFQFGGLYAADSSAPIRDIYVVHFVLDGLNLKMFKKLMDDNKLPTIKRQFIDDGAVFDSAVSMFPSTSTSIYVGFTSGLFPGHSGIPHLERFDRERKKVIGYLTVSGFDKINSDFINLKSLTNPDVISIDPPTTIFELLGDHPTAALYSSFRRGATYVSPKKAPIGALWATYARTQPERVDLLAMRKTMKLFEKDISKVPRYTLVGLYSTDIAGHKYGPFDEKVADIVVQFDVFLKAFLSLLNSRGIADKTYIIVSADHGMHDSGELFDFQEKLGNAKIAVKPANPTNQKYTLYVANRGVASSHIYVNHDGGFDPITDVSVIRRLPTANGSTIDLINFILSHKASDLVIARAGERSAIICGKNGACAKVSEFTIDGEDYYSYEYDKKAEDPLGYSANPSLTKLIDGRPHHNRAWLVATANEKYPDAVVMLAQIFHDGRAGDIFVTTRDHYGFRKVKAGNHGGATNDDMRVPLLISGPDIERGNFGTARACDLYPLILKWFGLEVDPKNYDGIDPFEKWQGENTLAANLAFLDQHADQKIILSGRLLELASSELKRRQRLTDGLEEYSKTARFDEGYELDHVAIVERTKKWAEDSLDRMKTILEPAKQKR